MSRMNAGIILAGHQPDMVNTLAQSSRAAAITNENQHRNALRQTYQEHGPGIISGDRNALNQLSRLDPRHALQVTQFNRQENRLDEQLGMRRKELDLKVQAFARRASAEEKAQAAAQMETAMKRLIPFYQAGDLDGINGALADMNEPPLQSVDQFPAIASLFGDTLETLKSVQDFNAPPAPLSGPGKVAADIEAGHLPAGTPLRGTGTTINVGDVQRSAQAGIVDTSQIPPSNAFGNATADATGTTGLVKGGVNTIGEAVGAGQAFPDVDKAQTALTSLSTKTMLGLSEEFPGRPSNLTRERIEELTVRPGEITTGPGRALNKTRDMLSTLQQSIDAANAVLLDTIYSQKDKAQAKTALRGLNQLYADYKSLEQSLAGAQGNSGKNTTRSGVSWEVIE